MFIRRALALVVAILWLWPAGLHAQSEALLEANNRGKALLEAGQYEQAIPFWRKALELGEKEFGPSNPATAALLDALAQTYHRQGRYAEAEPLYKRAMAIHEKALGSEHPDVAQSLNTRGRHAEDDPLHKCLLAIGEKALGPKHPDVATILENYGSLLRQTGRSAEANEMEARAKMIRAKHVEENPVN